MNVEEKIEHYKIWNIVFGYLHHAVTTTVKLVNPICHDIESLKYLVFFLEHIDFDKIQDKLSESKTIENCNNIHYGLEMMLRKDIDKSVINLQNRISTLSISELNTMKLKAIEIIGNLKRQNRENEAGISFTRRFNELLPAIKSRGSLSIMDYHIFILNFEETIANNLLSTFQIINETIAEIYPIIESSTKYQPNESLETGISPVEFDFTNNFDNIKTKEIYKHFKASLVDKDYLTEPELNEYLKAAFELKTVPETLFKLKNIPSKQKIYTVFYVYYKDISPKIYQKQKEYAALLGNYFEGYNTKIIQTNWAREYKTKR